MWLDKCVEFQVEVEGETIIKFSALRQRRTATLLFCKSSAKAGAKCSTGICSSFHDEESSRFD